MKTREEAKQYFQAQIGDAPKDSPIKYTPSVPDKEAHHYGRVEVEELLDFIYGTDEAIKWAEQKAKDWAEAEKEWRRKIEEERRIAELSEVERIKLREEEERSWAELRIAMDEIINREYSGLRASNDD